MPSDPFAQKGKLTGGHVQHTCSDLKVDWINTLFKDTKTNLYITQTASNEKKKKRDRRTLVVENHYHHHHQEALVTKMTMMTNHELKHNERP